ncbi:hypothetical protein M422DRAFT_26806 [Sphaerobolus stellatus SS14]|nr:hypothetical protein M422DRAFT_26806 [Sphaerobolus stellatus SS14]
MIESPAIPANPSTQLQVVLKWLEAWRTLNLDNILLALANNYKHQVLPKSLGRPVLNREEFIQNYKVILPLYTHLGTDKVKEIIEVPGKIFIHATSSGKSTTGAAYDNEYCLTFYLAHQDDDLKISHLKEFVDSKYTSEFFAEESKRQALKIDKHVIINT